MPTRFIDIIAMWSRPADLASDLGLPGSKGRGLVQQWKIRDSIPAEWFGAIVRAANGRGFHQVTHEALSLLAERNRLDKGEPSAPIRIQNVSGEQLVPLKGDKSAADSRSVTSEPYNSTAGADA